MYSKFTCCGTAPGIQVSDTKLATKINNGAKYAKWKEKCSRQIVNFEVICANPSDWI